LDETKFTLQKEKQTAQKRRITLIVDTAIKHGIVDILRDYRYKFSKKTKQISSALENQYSEMNITSNEITSKELGNGFLTQNYTPLHKSIERVLKDATLKNLTGIESKLTEVIKEEFFDLSIFVKSRAQELANELLKEFFTYLHEPMNQALAKLKSDESVLKEHIKSSLENEADKDAKQMKILKEIKLVEDVLKRCSL
jgi:hypothetical protein